MIRFSLRCEQDHEFEGWFRNNDDFDTQVEKHFVSCPLCNSYKVEKALMAPSVATSRRQEKIAIAMSKMASELREMAKKVRENSDYVGSDFAEEARKIHFGEAEQRGIYGEATPDEVESLVDDGVDVMPLPVFPDDHN
ncbi:DUF1178 family protein [Phyllobacterium endophyticum]|uniref:DUF1178 domain-containing protein n=1 Tax=Phyllobacterium endophyticum TaxID=1149773 RepID=A0A2P7ALB2_9HYPH|nr:DUF1178 family protein [Phyllobacterium endophyticum]MBB3236485.1 hypothetical protein [Phyllobacterium endophyticum]PSH55000.1 DUF1178 domain-containing protein [Phyllobacterium endophyticum]TYR40006.1 DUF1178 family protein [Phyllobacterium endophyticum]